MYSLQMQFSFTMVHLCTYSTSNTDKQGLIQLYVYKYHSVIVCCNHKTKFMFDTKLERATAKLDWNSLTKVSHLFSSLGRPVILQRDKSYAV